MIADFRSGSEADIKGRVIDVCYVPITDIHRHKMINFLSVQESLPLRYQLGEIIVSGNGI